MAGASKGKGKAKEVKKERKHDKGKNKARASPSPSARAASSAAGAATGSGTPAAAASGAALLAEQQLGHLTSRLSESLTCPVCLDTFTSPSALQCGHVACRKCLLAWFFRPDTEADNDDAAAAAAAGEELDLDSDGYPTNETGDQAGAYALASGSAPQPTPLESAIAGSAYQLDPLSEGDLDQFAYSSDEVYDETQDNAAPPRRAITAPSGSRPTRQSSSNGAAGASASSSSAPLLRATLNGRTATIIPRPSSFQARQHQDQGDGSSSSDEEETTGQAYSHAAASAWRAMQREGFAAGRAFLAGGPSSSRARPSSTWTSRRGQASQQGRRGAAIIELDDEDEESEGSDAEPAQQADESVVIVNGRRPAAGSATRAPTAQQVADSDRSDGSVEVQQREQSEHSESSDDDGVSSAPINLDLVRRARLARLGGGVTSTASAPSHGGDSRAPSADAGANASVEASGSERINGSSRSAMITPALAATIGSSSSSPSPPPPAATSHSTGPAPLPPAPQGLHRLRNLNCPQCRRQCSERPPTRIFVLDDLVRLLRSSATCQSSSPSAGASTSAAGAYADVFSQVNDKDETWGGLWASGGGENKRDKRARRQNVILIDADDGVRRCGQCNWEVDENSGVCNGCGRQWDLSSEDEGEDLGGDDVDLSSEHVNGSDEDDDEPGSMVDFLSDDDSAIGANDTRAADPNESYMPRADDDDDVTDDGDFVIRDEDNDEDDDADDASSTDDAPLADPSTRASREAIITISSSSSSPPAQRKRSPDGSESGGGARASKRRRIVLSSDEDE